MVIRFFIKRLWFPNDVNWRIDYYYYNYFQANINFFFQKDNKIIINIFISNKLILKYWGKSNFPKIKYNLWYFKLFLRYNDIFHKFRDIEYSDL